MLEFEAAHLGWTRVQRQNSPLAERRTRSRLLPLPRWMWDRTWTSAQLERCLHMSKMLFQRYQPHKSHRQHYNSTLLVPGQHKLSPAAEDVVAAVLPGPLAPPSALAMLCWAACTAARLGTGGSAAFGAALIALLAGAGLLAA